VKATPRCYLWGGETARNYLYKGYVKSFTKDYQGAIQNFNKAIDLDPKNVGVYIAEVHPR
jgi:hypothetical protein